MLFKKWLASWRLVQFWWFHINQQPVKILTRQQAKANHKRKTTKLLSFASGERKTSKSVVCRILPKEMEDSFWAWTPWELTIWQTNPEIWVESQITVIFWKIHLEIVHCLFFCLEQTVKISSPLTKFSSSSLSSAENNYEELNCKW